MLAPAANIKCDSLRHKPLTGPRYQIQRRRCQSATISPLVGAAPPEMARQRMTCTVVRAEARKFFSAALVLPPDSNIP